MIAEYKTERGATRYAKEIMAKFSHIKAYATPSNAFGYWVAVERTDTDRQGRRALAEKRPRNYSKR
jgi:hypothetical protein